MAKAEKSRHVRHKLDFYETNEELTLALLDVIQVPSNVTIVEPCNGLGAISRVLRARLPNRVLCYDIDPEKAAQFPDVSVADARTLVYPPDSLVGTNPPFDQAFPILRNARAQGVPCALLLRLSFLEPTGERGRWLAENPLDGLVVTPRYSFTGDGKGDSVTTAWMLWGIKPVNGFYHTALTQNFADKEAKYLARVTRQSTMRVCEATPDRETPRPQAAEASPTAEAAAVHATDATDAQTAGTVDQAAATPAAATPAAAK